MVESARYWFGAGHHFMKGGRQDDVCAHPPSHGYIARNLPPEHKMCWNPSLAIVVLVY